MWCHFSSLAAHTYEALCKTRVSRRPGNFSGTVGRSDPIPKLVGWGPGERRDASVLCIHRRQDPTWRGAPRAGGGGGIEPLTPEGRREERGCSHFGSRPESPSHVLKETTATRELLGVTTALTVAAVCACTVLLTGDFIVFPYLIIRVTQLRGVRVERKVAGSVIPG